MTITLAIPTYRRFDLCTRCVDSALAGDVPPDRVIVIDNSDGMCPPIAGAEMVRGRQPQSVAKAWNDAARAAGRDWLIVSNDDIVFAPDTMRALVHAASENPFAGVVSALDGERFALFLLRMQAWREMGGFDEGYQSAYFEDNHAARLLTMLGWGLELAPSAVRHEGSATIRSYDAVRLKQHHQEFRANEARYIRTWGGRPGHEVYERPRE